MGIELDTLEQRVVGALVEKELAVPDAYPLTLNSLVAACNQKSNRDPVMTVEDFQVEGALRALMDRGWVTRREPAGSRTMRYAHEMRDQLGVEEPDLAILSELLCRGPQAPGALKSRCARMHAFSSPADVEERLRALAARPVPYVEQLPRRPRERQARWRHCLGRPSGADAGTGTGIEAPARTDAPAERAAAMPSPDEAQAAPPPDDTNLEGRVETLEEQVAGLLERIDQLEGRHEGRIEGR